MYRVWVVLRQGPGLHPTCESYLIGAEASPATFDLPPRIDALFAQLDANGKIAKADAARIRARRTRRKQLSSLCLFCVFTAVFVLLIGAILAPGKRTVTSALRIMGLSQEPHFQNYHRVLNRAVWSSREVSRILLTLLVTTFAAVGDSVMGLDDTMERRRGEKITARGVYRDPVRSSHSHFVKASGLRWLSGSSLNSLQVN